MFLSNSLKNRRCQIWRDLDEEVKRQKVVILRELWRAIIYTTNMIKHVTKSHVRDAVHIYLVNWGAMLTEGLAEVML